ncbi:hypothetical protein N9W89_08270 [Hellea sp.]|nr:hypothetical protein [Hellea sp.]
MTDENKIDDAKLEEAEAVLDELETKDVDLQADEPTNEPTSEPVKPRKRFGLPSVLGFTFLSSVLGAGVMWLSTQYTKAPPPNLAPMQSQIKRLDLSVKSMAAERKTLKAQVTRLQREINNQPPAEAVDMTSIETRLDALENAEPTTIDPELVTRLEALQSDGSDALDLSDIIARLDALETRPEAPAPNLNDNGLEASDLSDIMARLDALEIRPIMKAAPAPSLNIAKPASLKSEPVEFPAQAVLNSLPESKSWLERSLKKHVSVQSDDNPRYLVDVINQSLADENIDAAIAAFDKLPPEAKAAAQLWRKNLNK